MTLSCFSLILIGSTLIKCGNCHQKLGQAHKEFIQSAATGFMQPLKSFLDGEMKTLAVGEFVICFRVIDQRESMF